MRYLCSVACALLLPLALLAPAAAAVDPSSVTAEDWKWYRDYQDARESEDWKKAGNDARALRLYLKDRHISKKALERHLAVVRPLAGDLKGAGEAVIRAAVSTPSLQGSFGPIEVKGRLLEVMLDLSSPHAVAYISWKNGNRAYFEEEACLVAASAARALALVKTLSLAEKDSAGKTIFSAKIAAEAARKISVGRIPDFADRRFIRLFEEVKRQ